jgi:hypothetical protein
MPDLIRVGVISRNVSGVGSRGYRVQRSGRTVTVSYGKIEAVGARRTRFYWCGQPTVRRHPRGSLKEARALARSLIRSQLMPNAKGSYQRLPPGRRIYSASRRPKAS